MILFKIIIAALLIGALTSATRNALDAICNGNGTGGLKARNLRAKPKHITTLTKER